MYKNDIMIGDIFLQRGVKRVFRDNGKIIRIDYINDDLVNGDNLDIDRGGADDIYQLYGYDMSGFKMNQYSTGGDLVFEIENMSLDDINKRFIKLSDFIKDGKFVGREFRRTQPVCRYSKYKSVYNGYVRGIRRLMLIPNSCGVIEDRSYMESYDNSKNIVLYVKDNMFLVKYISRYGEIYKIIDCSYVCDGNYEFYGDVYEEYMDRRDMVYSEIIKQIDSYNKKCFKTRIKVK